MDSLLGDNGALLEAAQEAMAAGRVEDAFAYLQALHGDLAEIASVGILGLACLLFTFDASLLRAQRVLFRAFFGVGGGGG
jgi:aminoglycoside/choline kinase family phosphotransferase